MLRSLVEIINKNNKLITYHKIKNLYSLPLPSSSVPPLPVSSSPPFLPSSSLYSEEHWGHSSQGKLPIGLATAWRGGAEVPPPSLPLRVCQSVPPAAAELYDFYFLPSLSFRQSFLTVIPSKRYLYHKKNKTFLAFITLHSWLFLIVTHFFKEDDFK